LTFINLIGNKSMKKIDLKDLARERESSAVMIAGLKNDVRRLLQMTFPELEHRCKLFTETMMRFLESEHEEGIR